MIPLMRIPHVVANWPVLVSIAETTACCLFSTFFSTTNRNPTRITEAIKGARVDSQLLVNALVDIFNKVCGYTGFASASGLGCNYNCPLSESTWQRREWLKYDVSTEKGPMTVYRSVSRFGVRARFENAKKRTGAVTWDVIARINFKTKKYSWFSYEHNLTDIKESHGIERGQPVFINIEVTGDGRTHPRHWFRGPFHGPWSNWDELHTFAVKIEWRNKNTGQWHVLYLEAKRPLDPYAFKISKKAAQNDPQRLAAMKAFKTDPTITGDYRKATQFIQFFKNRSYLSLPIWLHPNAGSNIKEVIWDHLQQTVSFRHIPEARLRPPTKVSYTQNLQKMWSNFAMGHRWEGLLVGSQPEPNWFMADVPTVKATVPQKAIPAC